ncbi:hypothetical protein ACQPZJ_06365 [Actinoplanes sp. CA-054009]
MITSILFASRNGSRFLTVWAVLLVAAGALSHRGLKVDFTQQYSPVVMTLPEFFAVVLTVLGLILLRPQLWILDRLGVPSRRWIPAMCAFAAGVAGPQVLLLGAYLIRLPPGEWSRSAMNVLVLTAVAFGAAPFVGAFAASGTVLVLYFSALCALQIEPALRSWSPLAVETPGAGHWAVALLLAVGATGIVFRTLGRTRLTWGRDLDLA